MWGASFNEIYDNCLNWGIRIDPGETHARDSTSALLEYNSNYNYIARNDFIHGGDGIFIRPLHGAPPMGNYFEGNDTSWANNNAVESWAPANVYVGNKANFSSYGFWIGGSDFTYMIGNEARNNGGNGGGMSNAAGDGYFGNAGFTCARGASTDHVLMMGNRSYDNFGPGLSILNLLGSRDRASHWLVQNNQIYGNAVKGYTGHGIALKNADWVDILSNRIEDNEQQKIFRDTDTSNIFIGSNEGVTTAGMPTLNVTAAPAVTFDLADSYMADIPQKIKDADFGIVRVMNVVVRAGEEVTFNAGAADPNGGALTYRWDFGDGNIETDAVVTKTFSIPGTYDAGLTVSNGTLGNLQGMIVTVLPVGEELAAAKADWTLSGGADLKAELVEDSIRRVAGSNSVRVNADAGLNYKLTSKQLDVDFSEYSALSLALDVQVEWGLSTAYALPIVRLCKDANNYIQYIPGKYYTAPINLPDSWPRYAFQTLQMSLSASNSQFSRSEIGSVKLNEIKYIEIVLGPQGQGGSSIAIDGLILTQAEPRGNLAPADSAAVVTDGAGSGNVQAILSNDLSALPASLAKYTTAPGEASWFGVDFNQPRYVNTIHAYYYYESSVAGLGKPTAVAVEYFDGTSWLPVTGLTEPVKPTVSQNVYTFDKVFAEAVRVVPVAEEGKSISIYGFKAFDTENLLAKGSVQVTSSSPATVDVTSVSVVVNKKKLTVDGALPLSDLKVMLYNVEGDKIVGAPLATVIVPEADVVGGGKETTVNLTCAGLTPLKRYAIAVSQTNYSMAVGGDIQSHYLFPTRSLAGVNEYYGKMNGSGGIGPESLGTAWIKVVTNQGTVDYMSGTPSGAGYGAGQRDEQLRYQTFTLPETMCVTSNDGSIGDTNGWTSEGLTGGSYWLQYDLGAEREIGKVALYLGTVADAQLPDSVKVEYFDGTEWQEFATADAPGAYVELAKYEAVTAGKLRVTIAGTDGTVCRVREVEAFADTKPFDISDLQALIAQAEALTGSVYTAESWAALQAALSVAKNITTASAYRDYVTARDNLSAALEGLVKKATVMKIDGGGLRSVKKGKTITLNTIYDGELPLSWVNLTPANISIVVSADGQSVTVTGLKAGTAMITVKTTDGSNITTMITISVTN